MKHSKKERKLFMLMLMTITCTMSCEKIMSLRKLILMKLGSKSFNTKKISINNILMTSTNSMLKKKKLQPIKPKRKDKKERGWQKIEMKIMMKQLDSISRWCSNIMMKKEMFDMQETAMLSHVLLISTSHKMIQSTLRS